MLFLSLRDALSSLSACYLFCLLPQSRIFFVFISLANSGTQGTSFHLYCNTSKNRVRKWNRTGNIYSAIAEKKYNKCEIVLRVARLATRYERINWPSGGPKLYSADWLFYRKAHVWSLTFDISNYFGASMFLFVEICLQTENWEWTSLSGKSMDVIWFYLSVPNELNVNHEMVEFNHFII